MKTALARTFSWLCFSETGAGEIRVERQVVVGVAAIPTALSPMRATMLKLRADSTTMWTAVAERSGDTAF
jgi:hypothetical protein